MNTTLTKITSHTHTSKILGKTQALFLQNSENCFITHTPTDKTDSLHLIFSEKNHQPDKSTDLSFGKEKSVNIAHFSDSTHSCYRLDDTETPLARSSFYHSHF